MEKYKTLRISEKTHKFIKILAAERGKTLKGMMEEIERLLCNDLLHSEELTRGTLESRDDSSRLLDSNV